MYDSIIHYIIHFLIRAHMVVLLCKAVPIPMFEGYILPI